ncbi:Mitochondrial inner membrane magnesium transporter LPE10 [Hypsizygus marmoreus]|uniref:Magnesium transporter n=1 Tax=Hypsizygus marmoreus TaxID=39966 RepID=A0A369K8V8_HYPMA|nr:Mitochondrial inner membrane magnesium transporter LPE10 [Hypsizygus marmoreus]
MGAHRTVVHLPPAAALTTPFLHTRSWCRTVASPAIPYRLCHLWSTGSLRNPQGIHSCPTLSRNISWKQKQQPRPIEFNGQEDVAKAAILEKVMKGRQPTDLMLRCTVLDAEGNVKTISGQFKKSDLSTEHRLNPRDLRKIDSRVPNLVPTILVRKEAILVNILHIRALVKADCVILFDTYGSADSRLHSVFLYHLEHNLKSKGSGSPYEFRALESILLSVLSALEAEMVFIRNLVGGLLAELEDNIDHDRFKRLLHYSRRLTSFQNRAKLVEEALEEVLGQDDDLNAMYLTDKKKNIIREHQDHEDLEVLLESFTKQVEEIVNEAENIESNVQSTQEIVELILDSNRNALLALDLKVSIATLGVGTGALIAGLFGMNLTSHMEQHAYAFYGMSATSAALALFVAWMGLRKLAKIRKVGLSNNQNSRSPSKPWLPLPLRRRTPDGWS